VSAPAGLNSGRPGNAETGSSALFLETCLPLLRAPARPALHAVFFLALALAAGVQFACGAAPIREYAYDVVFFLDNSWRVLNGLRPHADFMSAWGPVPFIAGAAGLKLARGSADGVAFAPALAGLLAGIWAYAVSLRRLPWFPAAFAGIGVSAMCAAPCALGLPVISTSYAMQYNRWGFALVAIVILECFPLCPEQSPARGAFARGLSSGAATAILLFTKASFALVAAVLILISLLLWNRSPRRAAGLAAGASLLVFALLWFVRFEAGAMLHDLAAAARLRGGRISPGRMLLAPFAYFQEGCLLPLALAAGVASAGSTPRSSERWRLVLLAGAVYVGGLALLLSNAQESGFPLNTALGVVLLGRILSPDFPGGPRLAAVLALFAILLPVPQTAADLASIGAAAWKKAHPPQSGCFRPSTGRFSELVFCESSNLNSRRANGRELAEYLSDGVALLEEHLGRGESVVTLDYYNPFPYALQRLPARGGIAAASYGDMLDERDHPSPESFFGGAAVVMVPKTPPAASPEAAAALFRIYGPALDARYAPAAESNGWRLYRRR
jgi:hypothetical protein